MTERSGRLIEDANQNIWRETGGGYELIDTSRDTRPSHELWRPGHGETKRGERQPVNPIREWAEDDEELRRR